MSNRSKNVLAAVAVFGIAAVASSQSLTAKPAPQQIAAVSTLNPAGLQH
jgi:hypothetical protein